MAKKITGSKLLKLRVWLSWIQTISNAHTAYKIEEAIYTSLGRFHKGDKDSPHTRPHLFDAYLTNASLPSKRTLDQIEKSNRFRDSSAYFYLPFWDVISEKLPEQRFLRELICSSRPNLTRYLHYGYRPKNAKWASILESPKTIDSLWKQGDIEALTVLLAIVRDAEHTNNQIQHSEAAYAAMYLSLFILSAEPYYSNRKLIFTYLSDHFFSKEYVLPNKSTFNLKADDIDVDFVISEIRNALQVAKIHGLNLKASKTRGRYVYWLKRLGILHYFAFSGDIWLMINEPETKESKRLLDKIKSRMKNDDRGSYHIDNLFLYMLRKSILKG